MNGKILSLYLIILLLLVVIGCTQQTSTQQNNIKNGSSTNNIVNTFSSDASKLKTEFSGLNTKNETFFTDVAISKDGSDIKMDFTVTPNVTSKMILNLFTLVISIKTYEVTQNFENLKINYLNDKKKVLGTMIIPKKAIKDVADYQKENNDTDFMQNPYVEPFWKISQRMYDDSVPELFPYSIVDDMFGGGGTDAKDIANALTKKVTHLEIECSGSSNWDADVEDDGITYYIKPLSEDDTVVPIDGSYELKVYERIQIDNWGWEFDKGQMLYSTSGSLTGQNRLKNFDKWNGYELKLEWKNIPSYMASSSDYGVMTVTFTDQQGNKFEALTGKESFKVCQLRES